MVEYFERTSTSADGNFRERFLREVAHGLTNFQRIVVATNGQISEEIKAYIIKVLDTIQTIDFAMDSAESRDDREKAEGQKVIIPSIQQLSTDDFQFVQSRARFSHRKLPG